MKENRFEKIARRTGHSVEKAQLKTHLRGLNKEGLKAFYGIFVHYWVAYKFFISPQNLFNLWCELNLLCREMEESFPDPYDRELIKSYCQAHPYYFIDILPPKVIIKLFCEHFDDRLGILARIAQKLTTGDLRAAYAYSNEALGLAENIDELVQETEKLLKEFS